MKDISQRICPSTAYYEYIVYILFFQVYICPWCDRVFPNETGRISHLLTDHGVEVREDNGVEDHVEVMGDIEVSGDVEGVKVKEEGGKNETEQNLIQGWS